MLTARQKKAYKSLGNSIKNYVTIGKEGFSSKVKASIMEALNNKELIKVKILDNCPDETNDVAEKISGFENVTVIQKIGRVILLHRPIPEEEK